MSYVGDMQGSHIQCGRFGIYPCVGFCVAPFGLGGAMRDALEQWDSATGMATHAFFVPCYQKIT